MKDLTLSTEGLLTNDKHIQHEYDAELEDVRAKVLRMGGLVEQQVNDAIKAITELDIELAHHVAGSDYIINGLEMDIDQECTSIIARRQPTATDLRLLITIIKVTTDLERIGDEAEKIGRFAAELCNDPSTRPNMHQELEQLSALTIDMLRNSLDVFARMDSVRAIHLTTHDQRINREYDRLSRLMITYMMENPGNITNALRMSWCARSLERIGDHSKNICEYVVYRVDGKDVRHNNITPNNT